MNEKEYFKKLNGYYVKDEEAQIDIQNINEETSNQFLQFEEYCTLNKQSSKAIQGLTTDGTYIYYIDWFGDDVDSYIVKCNMNGEELSRNNIGQGHFNSLCYCSKDNKLYTTTNPISIIDPVSLTITSTVATAVAVGTIDYLPEYDIFILNRINTNEYFYLTYDNLHNYSTTPSNLRNTEARYLYRFRGVALNDVRQGACFAGDFFFKISDRQRFGKKSSLIKYTQYGQYCCDVICKGIPLEKEYEDIFYYNNYFYIVAHDGKVYKASKYDGNNKSVLDYDTNPKLYYVYGNPGARFTLYNKNMTDLPNSIVTAVNDKFPVSVTRPYDAKYIDVCYVIEGQRSPYRTVRCTVATNNNFIANDMMVINTANKFEITQFRALFNMIEEDGVFKIKIAEQWCKKITITADSFSVIDVNAFDIFGFIAQY